MSHHSKRIVEALAVCSSESPGHPDYSALHWLSEPIHFCLFQFLKAPAPIATADLVLPLHAEPQPVMLPDQGARSCDQRNAWTAGLHL